MLNSQPFLFGFFMLSLLQSDKSTKIPFFKTLNSKIGGREEKGGYGENQFNQYLRSRVLVVSSFYYVVSK